MKKDLKPTTRTLPLHASELRRRATIMTALTASSKELAQMIEDMGRDDPRSLEFEVAYRAMVELLAVFQQYDKMHNTKISKLHIDSKLHKAFISRSIVMLADVISRPMHELQAIAHKESTNTALPVHLMLFHKHAQGLVPREPQTWCSL